LEKIYVNCGGHLYSYNSKKEVMSFFETCVNCSEGSERERYSIIYFDVKANLKTKKRCFTDNTSIVYDSDIKSSEIDDIDEKMLIDNYDISKEDILCFEAKNYLSKNHERIHNDKEFDSIEEIYDYYIKDNNCENRTFYLIDKEKIMCIDDESSDLEYFCHEFPVKDYRYADSWLKGEIEYEDYLNNTQIKDKEIC
jgi:hypothetical protein